MYRNIRLVYITTGNKAEARSIGKALVEERLAACINIIDGMESMYRWEGQIESGNETILIAKTTYGNLEQLTGKVKELHSYDCPCIITMTVTEQEGNEEYLNWLVRESKATKSKNFDPEEEM